MDKLLIVGAGGHGKVCYDIAKSMGCWSDIHFLDDNLKSQNSLEVIDTVKNFKKYINDYYFFVAIGDNYKREQVYNLIKNANGKIATLIHTSAIISEFSKISEGTVIMPNAVINSFANIGICVIINTSASVDHDCKIGDYVHISPGANLAGNVEVEKNSWLGIGSCVINNIKICSDVIVGAGAVVVKNIDTKGTYIGVPAKIILKAR